MRGSSAGGGRCGPIRAVRCGRAFSGDSLGQMKRRGRRLTDGIAQQSRRARRLPCHSYFCVRAWETPRPRGPAISDSEIYRIECTVTGGHGATVALSHLSAAARAASFARGCRLKRRACTAPHHTNRATSPTTSGRPARVTRDSASFSNQDGIFLQGSLYPRRNRIPRSY